MGVSDLLRYAMILRPSDSQVLVSGSVSDDASAYVKESGKLKEKMTQANLKPNERKKIVGKIGNWICECDSNGVLYLCCVAPEPEYPERLGYAYINELRKAVTEINNYFSMSPSELTKIFYGTFEKLSKKYNNPASFDSLYSVNSKVDTAIAKSEQLTKDALANQQDMRALESRSANLLTEAKDFNENADELRKVMYWRNMKLKMMISMVGGAASFSFVLPIIQKFAV